MQSVLLLKEITKVCIELREARDCTSHPISAVHYFHQRSNFIWRRHFHQGFVVTGIEFDSLGVYNPPSELCLFQYQITSDGVKFQALDSAYAQNIFQGIKQTFIAVSLPENII